MNIIWELLDVNKLRTTPYHPECDGETKRFNRTLHAMLLAHVNEDKNDWDQHLQQLAFAYNTSVHATTGYTPFELVYGRRAKLPIDLFQKDINIHLELTPEEYSKNLQQVLLSSFENVITNTNSKVDKMKLNHDRSVRVTSYNVNDLVWLHNDKDGKVKLHKKWIGPYKIVEKVNELNYAIKNLNKRSRRIIVHINRLKRCFMRSNDNTKNDETVIKLENESQTNTNNDVIAGNNTSLNEKTSSVENNTLNKHVEITKRKRTSSLSNENIDRDSIEYRLRSRTKH